MSNQYGMLIDKHRCVGCRTCMLACKMENRLPEEIFRMEVYNQDGFITHDRPIVNGTGYEMSWTPTTCMHCRSPKCLPACPVDAIVKRADGIVYIDQDKCNGCGACVTACPYGIPKLMDEYNVADKCDFCKHRVDTGRRPICVEVCPGRALSFGEIDAPYAALGARIEAEKAQQLSPEEGTNPSVYYKPEH